VSFGFVCEPQADVSFYRGDLANADEHFTRWSGFLDADGFRQVPLAVVIANGNSSWYR
jgi:hypothetical protein